MIGFMLSVLGSVVFWMFYIVGGFFVAAVLFKKLAPNSYKFVSTGKRDKLAEGADVLYAMLLIILFTAAWPVFSFVVIMFYIFKLVIFKFFAKAICFAAESVPDFHIVKKGDDSDESKSN